MKGPVLLGTFMGAFFALFGFIILTIIDGPFYGVVFGLGGGIFFGVLVGIWCAFELKKDKNRSDAFLNKYISHLVYETVANIFEGKKIKEVHIYVTAKDFRFVHFKGKKAIQNIVIPIKDIVMCAMNPTPQKKYMQTRTFIITSDHTPYVFSLMNPQELHKVLAGLNPAIIYFELRQKALSISFEELALRSDYSGALAVIVDINVGNGYITLACFADGTTSLYASNGSGRLGLGQAYEEIRQEAQTLLINAWNTIPYLVEAESTFMPENKWHRLYLITTDKMYAQDYNIEEIEKYSSELQTLNKLYQSMLASIKKYSNLTQGNNVLDEI